MDSLRPPHKRQRIHTDVPEGFLTSKTTNSRPKPSVPSFSSAFGEQEQPTVKRKTPLKSMKKLPSYHLGTFDRSASKENVDIRVNASDSSRPKLRKVMSVRDVHSAMTLEGSVPKLRPVSRVPPPLPVASWSKLPMKRIATPTFPVAKPPSKVLLPIQPPSNLVIPGRKLPPKEDMCTITTTSLGRMMDMSSENGVDELTSLLLRDQHPELYEVAEGTDYRMRGLELSPDRKGKGKASKFLRGGLASRASAHFDRTRTAFTLWRRQKEMELQRAHTLPSGADISATVVKVLYSPVTSNTRRSGHSTSLVALCRIRQTNGNAHASFRDTHLYHVAFTFLDAKTDKPESQELGDGDVVRIFKPWNEMNSSEDDKVIHRLPASLPLPSSAPFCTPDPLDAPIHDTLLFCTRFIVCERR